MKYEFLEKNFIAIGKKIAKNLMEEYNYSDFEPDSINIEREIYEVFMCYSRIFFFENKYFSNEENRRNLEMVYFQV